MSSGGVRGGVSSGVFSVCNVVCSDGDVIVVVVVCNRTGTIFCVCCVLAPMTFFHKFLPSFFQIIFVIFFIIP